MAGRHHRVNHALFAVLDGRGGYLDVAESKGCAGGSASANQTLDRHGSDGRAIMLKIDRAVQRASMWPQSTKIVVVLLFTFGFLASGGCYLDYPEHGGSAEVQGVVTLDGLPVNDAKIVFLPKKLRRPLGKIIPLGFGVTDANGTFTLQHVNGSPGSKPKEIKAGEYLVLVSKTVAEKDLEGKPLSPWQTEFLDEDIRNLARFRDSEESIPNRYNRETTLTYKVTPSPKILRPEFKLTSLDPLLAGDENEEALKNEEE